MNAATGSASSQAPPVAPDAVRIMPAAAVIPCAGSRRWRSSAPLLRSFHRVRELDRLGVIGLGFRGPVLLDLRAALRCVGVLLVRLEGGEERGVGSLLVVE